MGDGGVSCPPPTRGDGRDRALAAHRRARRPGRGSDAGRSPAPRVRDETFPLMTDQLAGTVPVATVWRPNPSAVVQARNLVKEYEGRAGHSPKRVVDGVSLQVGPGRVHAVMGLSGAGKSTLVGLLAGLLEPTGGEIYHRGEP